MDNKDFFTFSGYMKKEDNSLTASMEDYLEMIYRLSSSTGFTRIHELSEALNVQPPSATKMVQKLAELELINYEKYGFITLKEKGRELGSNLLRRHNIIESFLRMLGVSEAGILEETEKIEHTINEGTVKCFEDYVSFLRSRPQLIDDFLEYRKVRNNIIK